MSKAAIAVPYLIAIVIGVIILAVMVYLIVKYVMSPRGLDATECRTRIIEWCIACRNANWPDDPNFLKFPEELRECGKKYFGDWLGDNYWCANCGPGGTADDCKNDCCAMGVKNDNCP